MRYGLRRACGGRGVRAADAAKSLLHAASQRLLTSDPTDMPEVSDALDEALGWPIERMAEDDDAGRPFEPSFAETSANALTFLVSPTDRAMSAADRDEVATHAMRRIIGHHLGPGALRWFDGRTERQRSHFDRHGGGQGAMFTAGVDRGGVSEAAVTYAWGPGTLEVLPDPVYDLAVTAMEALPGLVPFYTTIRAGRHSGGQQVSFEIDRALALADLKPLMDVLDLGHQHGGLMSLTGFVLGARFTLPPRTATLTLLRVRNGVELRLDVNVDALPDAPQQLLPLLRLPMTERPRSQHALDRWMTALTPEGYFGPGNVTVLSVRVRPDVPARLALFLRPVQFGPGTAGNGAEARPGNGPTRAPLPA